VSDVPMGPRPAVTTQTTKEVNQLSPQSKKSRRSSQKTSDESGPDEQKNDQPEPESQVQQSGDQPEPEAQPDEQAGDQPESETQAQPGEQAKAEDPPESDEPEEQAKPEDPPEQPTVADVLTKREETVRFHNERTGGGDVHEGELQNQLDEHNERVGDASR
jgi:hypothetical protein